MEKKTKPNYVKKSTIDKIKADYVILLGQRSNGKSFALKEKLIKDAYNNGEQFGYLRRYREDCKDYLVTEYFNDIIYNKNGHQYIKEWTNGEYTTIYCYKQTIYLANVDENGKNIKGPQIGRMFGLSAGEHYKSLSFPNITRIVYEEFITDSDYLPDEPKKLMHLASTIFRLNKGTIYCIGNTISRICPYFGDWELNKIPKQKAGTIDYYNKVEDEYTVKIAVYLTDTLKVKNGLFFGNAGKAINGSVWDTNEQPHLVGHRDDYTTLYSMVFKYNTTLFLMEFLQSKKDPNNFTWFVSPKTTPIQKDSRIVANTYHLSMLSTIGFVPLTTKESLIFNFIRNKKICFADNLTGTEFYQCYKMV